MAATVAGAAAGRLGHRPGLDGLRAVAVALVATLHWDLGDWVGPGGWVGVDLFFTLSGFLITTLLLEEAAAGSVDLRAFYLRRARRLLPALALFLTGCTFWAATVGSEAMRSATTSGALSAAGYVANYVRTDYPVDLTSHTWSLAVEEHFYLAWPVVLMLAWRWRGIAGVQRAAIVGGLVAALLRVLELAQDGAGSAVYTQSQFRADGLLVGCAVAAWVRGHGWPSWRRPAAVAGVVWLGFVVAVGDSEAPWMQAWGFTANAVAAAAVVGWAVQVERGPLVHPALTRVGVISYGIYLWHNAIGKALTPWLHTTPVAVRVVLLAALTFAVASLSYELVERRLRRLQPAVPVAGAGVPAGQTPAVERQMA